MSIVHAWVAGEASVFPAGSVARTSNVWFPAASPVYVWPLAQALKAAPSSRHWKLLPVSLDVKLKLALVWFVGDGGAEVIVVCGGVVSIVHVWLAGEASVFPAPSIARTWNVCAPAARPV